MAASSVILLPNSECEPPFLLISRGGRWLSQDGTSGRRGPTRVPRVATAKEVGQHRGQQGEAFKPKVASRKMIHTHTRSVKDKVFDIWRSQDRFTKNPDLVQLASGRMLLIYSDTDAHWSQRNQVLTLLASDDGGQTWFKHREVDTADLAAGDERLVTPRLSLLKDGRLAVIVDHNDNGHFHEDQEPGNWIYWSEDGGDTWSGPQVPAVRGFEPDRIMDLPDGTLGVATHLMRGESQEFADVLWVSEDGGKTWSERATIAHDGYHRFCEGAIVVLQGGKKLACVLRENHSGGIPSFVTFSEDMTRYRAVRIESRRGLLVVKIDGETRMSFPIYREARPTVGFWDAEYGTRTQFGQHGPTGRSWWKRVSYEVKNSQIEDFAWSWRAVDGQWPDQYQRERLIQIHAQHPLQKPWPDCGYSSWVILEGGDVYLVDYTNCGDVPDTSHLVAARLGKEDLR